MMVMMLRRKPLFRMTCMRILKTRTLSLTLMYESNEVQLGVVALWDKLNRQVDLAANSMSLKMLRVLVIVREILGAAAFA